MLIRPYSSALTRRQSDEEEQELVDEQAEAAMDNSLLESAALEGLILAGETGEDIG